MSSGFLALPKKLCALTSSICRLPEWKVPDVRRAAEAEEARATSPCQLLGLEGDLADELAWVDGVVVPIEAEALVVAARLGEQQAPRAGQRVEQLPGAETSSRISCTATRSK